MNRIRPITLLALALSSAACSAIVNPDRDLLGAGDESDAAMLDDAASEDDASVRRDASVPRDAATPFDATVNPPVDSAVPPADASFDGPVTSPDSSIGPLDSGITPFDARVDAVVVGPDATITPDASITAGDTCSNAIPVTFPSFTTTRSFEGSFSDFTGSYGTPCIEDSPGADVVFAVDVPAGNDLQVDTDGSGADTVLSVSTTCPSGSGSFDLVCNDDVGDSSTGPFHSRIWLHNTTPLLSGSVRYYVLLKTFDIYSSADFAIRFSVRVTPSDTCSGSPLNITGGGTVYGITTNLTSVRNGSCGSSNELEAAFRVDIEDDDAAPVFVATSRDFSPELYIRTTCALSSGSDEEGCTSASVMTSAGRVTILDFESGDLDDKSHRLFVDGAGSGDAYTLDYIP